MQRDRKRWVDRAQRCYYDVKAVEAYPKFALYVFEGSIVGQRFGELLTNTKVIIQCAYLKSRIPQIPGQRLHEMGAYAIAKRFQSVSMYDIRYIV